MAVSTTTNRESFTGGAGPFSFTFKAFEETDIKVVIRNSAGVETTLTKDTHYTVAVNDDVGGTVTLAGSYISTPPTSADTVVVYREIPYTQEIDLIENDPQHADVIEEGFDRATVLIQQLKDLVSRSLVLPVSATQSGLTLPEPSAAKYLRWNDGATALENVSLASTVLAVSAFMETLLDDADASAALTTLGFGALGKSLVAAAQAASARTTLGVNGRVNKTQANSPYTVVAGDLNGAYVFTNTGATGEIIFQLPVGADGYRFMACVTAAYQLTLKAATGEKFRFLETQGSAGGTVYASTVGYIIKGYWSGTEWVIDGLGRAWTYT
jgi:hypothetical protein